MSIGIRTKRAIGNSYYVTARTGHIILLLLLLLLPTVRSPRAPVHAYTVYVPNRLLLYQFAISRLDERKKKKSI